ncbi:hypothetical protein [Arthrobacter rhombi]|uniref:hypothetical protein n=1 Tax=Arthrobacter rhombi TaxID=71253 RepID=UPI003FCF54AB
MPDTNYFMVMWTIPETFAGMVSMCLRRSRNMLLLAGIKAPIMSFDAKGRTDVLTVSLLRRGHLLDGMEILNIFDFYGTKKFAAVPSGSTRRFQDVD